MNTPTTTDHEVVAIPVMKMDSHGPIGYRFECSCGRKGKGVHHSEAGAIQRGHDHIKMIRTKNGEKINA